MAFTALSHLVRSDGPNGDKEDEYLLSEAMKCWDMLEQSQILPTQLLSQYSSMQGNDYIGREGRPFNFPVSQLRNQVCYSLIHFLFFSIEYKT